ncbi:MAG: CDP-alcohol phosphatidyltransferase family protein [Myxococcota bacterium]|jgi:phosphatidylcholine synthase
MSEPADRPSRARSLVLAWGVHFFTASGAVVGALALLAISAGELDNAALLMLFALFIDAVDGSLARAVGVSEVLPDVDGRRLDDIVDFLNFVIVPVVFMTSAGSLPGWGWVAAPILASAYGFSQASAKTEDDFFLGWPSYWNVVALYCWLLDLSTTTGAFWLVVCSIGIFLPFKYVYPSKMKRPIFKHTLTAGGFVWAGLLGFTILAPDLGARLHLVEISFAYLVYYMALSIWLGNWKRGWG